MTRLARMVSTIDLTILVGFCAGGFFFFFFPCVMKLDPDRFFFFVLLSVN